VARACAARIPERVTVINIPPASPTFHSETACRPSMCDTLNGDPALKSTTLRAVVVAIALRDYPELSHNILFTYQSIANTQQPQAMNNSHDDGSMIQWRSRHKNQASILSPAIDSGIRKSSGKQSLSQSSLEHAVQACEADTSDELYEFDLKALRPDHQTSRRHQPQLFALVSEQ